MHFFALGFVSVVVSFTASGAQTLDLNESSLRGFSEMAKVGFANFKSARPSVTATSSHGILCPMSVWNPPYLPYLVSASDVQGEYAMVQYRYGFPDPGPNVPTTIIFAWHRSGAYAPWFVYAGRESISDAKVGPAGEVSFWHKVSGSSPSVAPFDELVVCGQSANPIDLNSEYTAYPCFQDSFTPNTSMAHAVVVETVAYNLLPIFGQTFFASDGYFTSQDWSKHGLLYGRRKPSINQTYIKYWDRGLGTVQPNPIDWHGTTITGREELIVNQVDTEGTIGYQLVDTGIGVYTRFFGIVPSMVSGVPVYNNTGPFESFAGTNVMANTSNFVSMGTETQILFGTLDPAVPHPTQTGVLRARTSVDNFYQTFDVLLPPQSNKKIIKPRKVRSSIYGEMLMAESMDDLGYSRVELFLYQGPQTPYLHFETIDPMPPYQHLSLSATTDAVDPTTLANLGAAIGIEHNGSTQQGRHVLMKCY